MLYMHTQATVHFLSCHFRCKLSQSALASSLIDEPKLCRGKQLKRDKASTVPSASRRASSVDVVPVAAGSAELRRTSLMRFFAHPDARSRLPFQKYLAERLSAARRAQRTFEQLLRFRFASLHCIMSELCCLGHRLGTRCTEY